MSDNAEDGRKDSNDKQKKMSQEEGKKLSQSSAGPGNPQSGSGPQISQILTQETEPKDSGGNPTSGSDPISSEKPKPAGIEPQSSRIFNGGEQKPQISENPRSPSAGSVKNVPGSSGIAIKIVPPKRLSNQIETEILSTSFLDTLAKPEEKKIPGESTLRKASRLEKPKWGRPLGSTGQVKADLTSSAETLPRVGSPGILKTLPSQVGIPSGDEIDRTNSDVTKEVAARSARFSERPPEEFIIANDSAGDYRPRRRSISPSSYSEDEASSVSRKPRKSIALSEYSESEYGDDDDDSEDDAEVLLAQESSEFGKWRCPDCNIDRCLPNIRAFSSIPEFIFYICSCINCVCAIYMFTAGVGGSGFQNSVKSILIQDDSDTEERLKPLPYGLNVGGRGILIATLSFSMYFFSLLGCIGFYYAIRPLIKINLWVFAFIAFVQVVISLSIFATPNSCAKFNDLREPMRHHMEEFYTDSLNVPEGEPYQDHAGRINDMQSSINCCGVDSYTEFLDLPGINPANKIPPYSCCQGAWRLNVVCNTDPDEYESKISQVGCEERVKEICYTVTIFMGVGGFSISLLLSLSIFTSYICYLYHIRIQKAMIESEIVYVERLNLFMPEILEDEEEGYDEEEEGGEKKLIMDTDKIHLSEKVSNFVDQVRKEYGMDDLVKKKRIIVKKQKKDKIILAPFEMKMAEKRRFSMVAGRHNYFLNRQMLKYAAHIVTSKEGDESYATKKTTALDDKMRQLREAKKKEEVELAARTYAGPATSQANPEWKFNRKAKPKQIPKFLLEHHKAVVEQRLERKKLRDKARKEKKLKDEEEERENQKQKKFDVLNRLLTPKVN